MYYNKQSSLKHNSLKKKASVFTWGCYVQIQGKKMHRKASRQAE